MKNKTRPVFLSLIAIVLAFLPITFLAGCWQRHTERFVNLPNVRTPLHYLIRNPTRSPYKTELISENRVLLTVDLNDGSRLLIFVGDWDAKKDIKAYLVGPFGEESNNENMSLPFRERYLGRSMDVLSGHIQAEVVSSSFGEEWEVVLDVQSPTGARFKGSLGVRARYSFHMLPFWVRAARL